MIYEVQCIITTSAWTEIEADSPEDAIARAKKRLDNEESDDVFGREQYVLDEVWTQAIPKL